MPFRDKRKMDIVERFQYNELKNKKRECAKCGTTNNLTWHHKNNNPIEMYVEDNLVCLCEKCHVHEHEENDEHYKRWLANKEQKYYAQLNAEMRNKEAKKQNGKHN